MREYCYEIYYKYDGPSLFDPFVKEKSKNEIEDAFHDFCKGLPHYIDSSETYTTSVPVEGDSSKRKVTIKTKSGEDEVTSAVDKCLQSVDLRATRLK